MPVSSPDLNDVLEISYSRVKLVLLTLVYLGLVGVLGFWAYMLFASGNGILYLIGIGPALFLLAVLVAVPSLVRVWLHRGPVITMDVGGIRDARQPDDFVEWTDVAEVELGFGSASYRLCFTFRDSTRERGGLQTIRKTFRLLTNTSDWSIDLRLLEGGRLRIWQAAKHMRQLGIRQHVRRSQEALARAEPPTEAGEHRLEY
jgi:hypothetical protein